MSNNDEFAEAVEAGSGSGDTWKPEEQAVIFGTYKAHKSNVGPNNSEVYVIKEDDKDEPTSVWGSTVLDSRFEEIPIGSRVKIEYLGKTKGKRAEYKDYKVVYVVNKDVANVANVMGEGTEVE
jgi:hypothetical protein